MAVGLVQDESVGSKDESQDYQDEAGPAGQIAWVDVWEQARAWWCQPCRTPPTHQGQEGDNDGNTPEGQETQQGSPAGQYYLVPGGLVYAQITVQSCQQ